MKIFSSTLSAVPEITDERVKTSKDVQLYGL